MKQRPILIAVIGYIIGILWGLYLKISIVSFYILLIAIYIFYKSTLKTSKNKKLKLISLKRYYRYIKLFINKQAILILTVFSVISYLNVVEQNKQYEKMYQQKDMKIIGTIISQKTEKQYYNIYKMKILNSQFSIYIQVKKGDDKLEYGDKVIIKGQYQKPSVQRNEGGYDESQYLKTQKIIGRIKVNSLKVEAKEQINIIQNVANKINLQIKKNIDSAFNSEKSAIIKGLILGEKQDINKNTKEKFQILNISHILAISGMHVGYIIIGIQMIFSKLIGKRKTRIITIIILFSYLFITNFSPSIIRASIMGILLTTSGLIYRKNDILNSISISLIITLTYNPFLILDIGLQLSYLGTVSIILFHSIISQMLKNIKIKKLKEILSVTISAQILILPILLYHFNLISVYSIIANLFISIIIGPTIILTFIGVGLSFIYYKIMYFFSIPLNMCIEIINFISKLSELPFSKIYVPTPQIQWIITYFIVIFVIRFLYKIYKFNYTSATCKRVKNLMALLQYKFRQNKMLYCKCICVSLIILVCVKLMPKDLKIYFVDVGQGDCTFIVTPHNKTILIDGGGSLNDNFDIGKQTLIPYLLDRGYTSVDYVVISHFDQDHVGGIISVMEELKVKNIIIGKQYEKSDNYETFLEIIKNKNLNVIVAKKGTKIAIEKDVFIDVLWPNTSQEISENSLNNNALVFKLNYKDFKMLFTGDIEEKAENVLTAIYRNSNILESDILKVGHHGSKTSSTQQFIDLIKPKVALIGVGENNNFGHPNEGVLQRLQKMRYNHFENR